MTCGLRPLLLAAGLALAAPAAQAADWEGPYVGAYAGTVNWNNFIVGAQAGYNFSIGDGVYAGVEADAFWVVGGTNYLGSASARLAFEAAPDVLLYGQLGLARSSNGFNYWLAGAGMEYAVTDEVSLRAGVERLDRFGPPGAIWVAKAGLTYRF